MAITDELVKNIVHTTYDTLPVDVIEPTKIQILDTLGVAVAGTSLGTVDPMIDLVKEWGGKKEATILVYGDKVPAANAAMVNGFLAAVLDYDDTHMGSGMHISATIVIPGLAMAECLGGVSGRDFITAVALGYDLSARLGQARSPYTGSGPAYGGSRYFGATAVSGKLLNLGESNMRNALGIVMDHISPGAAGYGEGASSKGAWGGLVPKGGIISAFLAQTGMTGISDIVEGPTGFYHTFQEGYIPDVLTVDLGEVYAGTTNSIKVYPCCHMIHNSLDATLALVKAYDIQAEDVSDIKIYVGSRTVSMFRSEDRSYHPKNPFQCQFSFPWCAASAVVYRSVGLDRFTENALRDKKVMDLSQKVTYKLNPELTGGPTFLEPVVVEIKLNGGELYAKRVDTPSGSPWNPVDWDRVVDKFRDCCDHAAQTISQENVDKVIGMIASLEDVSDVGEIVHLLA